MSAPTVDWPPQDVLDEMGEYLEALQRLLRAVVAFRDRWGPLIQRYSAWAESEDRPDGWFATTDVLFGMDRAAILAGAIRHLADGDLTYGGCYTLHPDDFAELIQEVMR